MAEDLTFTFDTEPFKKGIDAVSKGMQGLKTSTTKVAKGIARGLTKVALKIGGLFVAFKGIKGMLKSMPEIGESFGIAKDIFLKNFLYPLRKQVMPLLQKLLDWVRDNRTTFVKWGQTLANIFTSIVSGVKRVIGFASKLVEGFIGFSNAIFGTQIRNVQDLFNLISFKFAAIITFITGIIDTIRVSMSDSDSIFGNILSNVKGIVDNIVTLAKNLFSANGDGNSLVTVFKSIAETAGIIFEKVTGFVKSFLDGFVPAVKNLATPLQGIVEKIQEIFSNILGGERGDRIKKLFEVIGNTLGVILVQAFKAVEQIIKWMEPIIYGLMDVLLSVTEVLFPSIKKAREEKEQLAMVREMFTPEQARFVLKQIESGEATVHPGVEDALRVIAVEDALITKKGDVVKFNPNDNIMAFQGDMPGKSFNINIPTTVIVENGTVEEGRNVAIGIMDELERQFNMEYERGGF